MDELDQDLQKRVWQRVQRREEVEMPPLGRDNLRPWMTLAQENTAAYQNLHRQFSGKEAEQLRRLQQESQKCIACMKGICRLRRENVKQGNLPAVKEPPRKALEKCYHRERRLWEGYEQQATDPEHGIVFGRLALQAQEHCVTIMEILGRME